MGNKSATGHSHIDEDVSDDEDLSAKDFTFNDAAGDWRIDPGYGKCHGKPYSCFSARSGLDDYYHFRHYDDSRGKPSVPTGYKIHLSLRDFANTRLAWNLILPLLVDFEVFEFKVRMSEPSPGMIFQLGKDIVIYHFSSRDDLPWAELLGEIETELRRAGVVSGAPPKYRVGGLICDGEGGRPNINEPAISGSSFLYVERDGLVSVSDITPQDFGPFSGIQFEPVAAVQALTAPDAGSASVAPPKPSATTAYAVSAAARLAPEPKDSSHTGGK